MYISVAIVQVYVLIGNEICSRNLSILMMLNCKIIICILHTGGKFRWAKLLL